MEVKSLGAFPSVASADADRDQRIRVLREDAGFERATPPQADSKLTQDQLKEGLARFAGQVISGKFNRSKETPNQRKKRALAYNRQSHFEEETGSKGNFLNTKI